MSAIIRACNTQVSVKNTGKECDTSMVATAMLIAIQKGVKFDDDDLADPVAWLTDLIHQRKAFPLFGLNAPIRTITNNAESDVLITMDDGAQIFLRYGVYNRIFETTSGGLCYAQALQSFNKSGYSIIEIDQQGQMMVRKNSDGTYSGFLVDFMYSPSPILPDFRTNPWKSRFQLTYSPVEIVTNGLIFQGASQLLSMGGLIDAEPVNVSTTQTITNIFFGVKTECAQTDLVDLIGAPLATISNWIVKNKITGVVVTPSAGAVVGGQIRLTGTYVSGQTYVVSADTPETWQANDVEGYDGTLKTIDIAIP